MDTGRSSAGVGAREEAGGEVSGGKGVCMAQRLGSTYYSARVEGQERRAASGAVQRSRQCRAHC